MSKKTEAIRSLAAKVRFGAPMLVVAGVTILVAGAVAMRSSQPETELEAVTEPADPSEA